MRVRVSVWVSVFAPRGAARFKQFLLLFPSATWFLLMSGSIMLGSVAEGVPEPELLS